MKYPRPAFGDPNVKVVHKPGMFGMPGYDMPVPDRPISIRENFWRAAKRCDPVWIPNSGTDINSNMLSFLNGMPEADFTRRERHDFTDWFGVQWMFVPEAGGPMLKPGTQFMDDITQWEKKVRFPRVEDYDFKGGCERWYKNLDHEKVTQVNIGLGCTERLVALMGGYTDAMLAMAMEPEAVHDFLMAFAEWDTRVVDKLCQYLPVDFITYHDDWGTERDTFFSEKMMEDIVFEPTKLLFSHMQAKGIVVQHHCCGNIKRFLPYMCETGADFMQLQARANDMPALKAEWGDRIGFEVGIEPAADAAGTVANVRRFVDTYGKGGGVFTSVSSRDPQAAWEGSMELFYYSREKYDDEREARRNAPKPAPAAAPAFPGFGAPPMG